MEEFSDRNETRDALDQRWPAFVREVDAVPMPVPNRLATSDSLDENFRELQIWLSAVRPQAIILTGGDDPGIHPMRDRTENALINYARKGGLPLLGICRGMQMLALAEGASLKPVAGHIAIRHRVTGVIAREVNSYHGLALGSCPMNYEILASDSAGEIEAIKHNHLPWEGWMWHPERETQFSADDLNRFGRLIGNTDRKPA